MWALRNAFPCYVHCVVTGSRTDHELGLHMCACEKLTAGPRWTPSPPSVICLPLTFVGGFSIMIYSP